MTGPVLVTGATGFIGRRVVAQLLAAGRPVRILARRPESLPVELAGRVRIWRGDLGSLENLASALTGVDTVLHLAGCARAWSRDPDEFHRVNVAGVGHLLRAAGRAGVRRLVHVSTVLTHPAIRRGRPAARRLTPYESSKLQGERLVRDASRAGVETVVVHPTRVYGPGPLNDANGVTRLVALALRGPVVLRLADRGVAANYVHVADVARGILLAAERGEPGGDYLLGGDNASLAELLRLVAVISGRPVVSLRLPRGVALALAHLARAGGWIGLPVPITPEWVRLFLEDHAVDIEPDRRSLGYEPRSLRAGLEETIQWLRARFPRPDPSRSPILGAETPPA